MLLMIRGMMPQGWNNSAIGMDSAIAESAERCDMIAKATARIVPAEELGSEVTPIPTNPMKISCKVAPMTKPVWTSPQIRPTNVASTIGVFNKF